MGRVTISAEVLKNIFKVGKVTIAGECIWERPALKFIKITVTDTEIISESLDGYQMARLTQKHTDKNVQPFTGRLKPVLISRDLTGATIEAEETEKRMKTSLTLHYADNEVVYTFFPEIGKEFIDFDSIKPDTEKELSVSFNAAMMTKFMKCFTGYRDDKDAVVTLKFKRKENGINEQSPMLFTKHVNGVKVEAVLLPVRVFAGD